MNTLPTPLRPGGSGRVVGPTLPLRIDAPPAGDAALSSPLLDLWSMVWRHRWLILAILAGALLLGFYYSKTMVRPYVATARIQIDRAPVGDVTIDTGTTADTVFDYEFFETQYELLKSRRLAEKVVDALALDEDAGFLVGDDEEARASLSSWTGEQRYNAAVGRVRGGTSVSPVADSRIVDLQYAAMDPERAAQIANALAEQYVDMDLEQRFEATQSIRAFLSERLEEARVKLEESEREAATYARERGLVSTIQSTAGRSGSVRADTLTSLNTALAEATARRIAAEAQLRANGGGEAASVSLQNGAIGTLRKDRALLAAELGKLESDFGPEYPAVAALRAQISDLDDSIAREQAFVNSGVSSRMRDSYREAQRAESSLRAQVAAAKSDLLGEQSEEIGLNIIQRDIDTQRQLYDGLLERFKAVGVAGASSANRVSIVDRAMPPGGPSGAGLSLILTISLALGMAVAAGLVFLLDQVRRSRLTPDDIGAKLGLPLIGQTPKIEDRSRRSIPAAQRLALSESYFSALTALQFQPEHGMPRSTLVTSSRQYEGKTTTSLSLARDLASTGARVLLVDADLRSPSIHSHHGQPLDRGLSDLLRGRVAAQDVLHAAETENLTLMFAGTPPPNPAQLLSSDRFGVVIEEMLGLFDYVIVDGPPVLGLADAPLLARAVEGTVFVIESNKTPARTARSAIERLVAVDARIVGALITKFDARRDGYGYGYGYGYGEQYGYGRG